MFSYMAVYSKGVAMTQRPGRGGVAEGCSVDMAAGDKGHRPCGPRSLNSLKYTEYTSTLGY